MAKRIMLSVLPSVMTEAEKFHSGGFDYKALKSAANGVKDLVKYGTAACVGEMQYYGVGIKNEYNNLVEKSILHVNEEEFKKIKTLQAKYNKISDVIQNVKDLKNAGRYKECLLEMVEKFNDVKAWESSYGGKAWGKIAETLLKMCEKKEMLDLIRQEYATKPDPKTDYLALEIETLKEIVVLMNVFDGLAHNNGSVMPKVIQEEFEQMPHSYSLDDDDDETTEKEKIRIDEAKEIKRVKNLMDVKEINDPFIVYKALQKIIERPENKHLFGDWVERIKNNPGFAKAKSLKEMRTELEFINARKKIISEFQKFDPKLDIIYSLKDQIINASNGNEKQQMFAALYSAVRQLRDSVSITTQSLENMTYYDYKSVSKQISNIKNDLTNSKLRTVIQNIASRADQAKYGGGPYDDDNFLISDINNLKIEYRTVIQLVDKYLVEPQKMQGQTTTTPKQNYEQSSPSRPSFRPSYTDPYGSTDIGDPF